MKMKKKLDEKNNEFKIYHAVFAGDQVIDTQTKRFHKNFISGDEELSAEAKDLRNVILNRLLQSWIFTVSDTSKFKNPKNKRSREPIPQKNLDDQETKEKIEEFYSKFIFLVSAPNEEELDPIVKKELSKNPKINVNNNDLYWSYVSSEINNWFKNDKNFWLSAEEGEKNFLDKVKQKMVSIRATLISLDYQQDLNRMFSFNSIALREMADKLASFLGGNHYCNSEKLEEMHITSPSPKFTAIKIIAALKSISTNGKLKFQRDDSFLVTSSSRFQKGGIENELIKKALLTEGNPQQLLIIVNDKNSLFQIVGSENALFTLAQSKSLKGKKFIVISQDRDDSGWTGPE